MKLAANNTTPTEAPREALNSVARGSASSSTNTITWVKNDAPPFYIIDEQIIDKQINGKQVREKQCHRGFGDQLQDTIERKLNNYRHQTIKVPLSRLEATWSQYTPLCFATMIHEPPVNNEYIVSRPNALYLPHGIITRKDHADRIPRNEDGTLSLTALLSNPGNHRMGQIAGRTYGETIDTILAAHSDNLSISERAGSTETAGILQMLSKHRFDFIIEYEFVLNHHIDQGDFVNELVFIPIAETRGQYVLGAIGCSASDSGRQAINAINSVLPELVTSREYRRAVADWLVPAEDEVFYWQNFDNVQTH
ncbi:MAG: TIGR02285 family protein, partial [Thalassolituus sp.]